MTHSRAAAPLVLAVCLLALPGCGWLFAPGPVAGGGSVAQATPDDAATANVRNAIPALEAYYAESSSYAGATPDLLRKRYDPLIGDVEVVPSADGQSYCVESTVGNATFRKRGPASGIEPGGC